MPDKEVKPHSEGALSKSLHFVKGIPRACHNPLCRRDFTPKRKDQRFCDPKCKETFFKVKYGLLALATYFNVDLQEAGERSAAKTSP
jgi:hypothetical protein